MPSCQRCNKALAEDTTNGFCDSCQSKNESLKSPKKKTPFRKNLKRYFLIFLVSLIFPSLNFTFNVLLPRRHIPLAEQTVIEAVQSETGKTPVVSSQVAGHYVSTIIAVRYAFTEEELKNKTCPTYYVTVSGSSKEITLVEKPPPSNE